MSHLVPRGVSHNHLRSPEQLKGDKPVGADAAQRREYLLEVPRGGYLWDLDLAIDGHEQGHAEPAVKAGVTSCTYMYGKERR